MAVVTAAMFEVKLLEFVFVFSLSATMKTIFYFGLIYLLVMVFNTFAVGREKLITLLYADRKIEKFKPPHLVLSVFLFVIAVVCLGVAYKLILENGLLILDRYFYSSIILGCIGTFLFFFSLSGFFLKIIQQSKKTYLKNLNMFVLRQLNSKINTTYISMTMVCLMLFLAISTLSAGIGMSKGMTNKLADLTPYDATYLVFAQDNQTEEYMDLDMMGRYREAGVDFHTFAKGMTEINRYQGDADIFSFQYNGYPYVPDFVTISDYNKLLALQGKEPVTLGENSFIINSNHNQLKEYHLENMGTYKVNIAGRELHCQGVLNNTMENASVSTDVGTVIVEDSVVAHRQVVSNQLSMLYIQPSEEYEKLWNEARGTVDFGEDSRYANGKRSSTKIEVFTENKSLSVTVAYITVYVGVVFLITSAAVLTIIQLSEASDNVKRYGLLKKIGTEKGMINKALLLQIAVYFSVPLLLAIVHSVVGISVAGNIVELFGDINIIENSLWTALIIIIIYGGYFLATYLGSKGIINKK